MPCRKRPVDSGDQPLGGSLLVPRRPVDLPREKQAGEPLGFEAHPKFGRLNEIVLHCVARSHDHGIFETRQRMDELFLNSSRQTHRVAVDVDLVDVETLRLEKNLVTLTVREAHHLVFE